MVFLVLLIPIGVLVFALLMERIERRLHTGSMSEQDVAEFFDNAKPDEVTTFIKEGWSRALSRFRVRSRANRPSRRARAARSGRSRDAVPAASAVPAADRSERSNTVIPATHKNE